MKFKYISFLFIIVTSSACKKQENSTPLTPLIGTIDLKPVIDTVRYIDLHGETLENLQKYINGKWDLKKAKGGFCGACTFLYTDRFWNFFTGNKIQQIVNNTVIVDTTIFWDYKNDVTGRKSYVLSYFDKRNYPEAYIVYGVKNDTLLLISDATEPTTYYFTKSP